MASSRTTIHFAGRRRAVDGEHPWLGLASFDERTQEWFFGRDREIRDLFRRVREHPLTVLFGRSGLGKTSLLGAGLLPKLRVEGYRPVLLRLRLDADAPPLIEQVQEAVDRAVGAAVAQPSSLWERFCHLPTRPADLAAAPPVIVFDQFEEVFTLATEPRRLAEQARLATELADLIEHRPPESVQRRLLDDSAAARDYDFGPSPVRVVIALREDYLSLIEAWNKLLPSVMRNRMQLRELDGPQALEAVVKPGRRAGMGLVDDGVGGRIVRFVADRPADTPLEAIAAVPPLLSLVCDELNQARIAAELPAITADLVDHQSRDILRNFYERAFDGIPDIPLERREWFTSRGAVSSDDGLAALGAVPTAREYVRRFVEDRLVTVSGHRTPVAREDAIDRLASAGVPDPAAAIDHLVQGRLLTAEERDGLQRLEITHDVLADLVVRSRDDRRERERARRAEEALAAQRKRLRRQRAITAALGVLTIASLAAGATAWWQARKAHEAEQIAMRSQRETAEALGKSETLLARASRNDLASGRQFLAAFQPPAMPERRTVTVNVERPDGTVVEETRTLTTAVQTVAASTLDRDSAEWRRGVSFLVRSLSLAENPDAARIALAEVSAFLRGNGLRVPAAPAISHEAAACVMFEPGGRRVVSAGGDGTVRFWDPLTGTPAGEPVRLDEPVTTVAFSPDGGEFAVGTAAGFVRRFDASGKAMGQPLRHEAAIADLAFSPSGGLLAVAAGDRVQVYDLPEGEAAKEPVARANPLVHPDGIVALAFGPDGTWLATLGGDGAVRLWSTETGTTVGDPLKGMLPSPLEPEPVGDPSFAGGGRGAALVVAPDGATILATLGGDARIWWRVADEVWRPDGAGEGAAAAVSPDGLFAIIGGPTAEAVIVRLHDGIPNGNRGDGMPAVGLPLPAAALVVAGGLFAPGDAFLGQCGPPLRLDAPVVAVAWSAKGDLVATLTEGGTLVVWASAERCPPAGDGSAPRGDDVAGRSENAPGKPRDPGDAPPEPPSAASPATRDWITAVSGVRFDDDGNEAPVTEAWRQQRWRSVPLTETGWAELAGWLVEQGPQRRAAPFAAATVRERALLEREAEDAEAAWRVLEYDPGCPAVRLRLANLVGDQRRAGFLRKFELERLPDEPVELALAARWLLDRPGGLVGGGGAGETTCREAALDLVERAGRLSAHAGQRVPDEIGKLRIRALAENGMWDEAVTAFREAALAAGAKASAHHELVWALLAAGRRDEAHAAWLVFTEAFAESAEADVLDELAWTGLLIPALPAADAARAREWARRAVELETTNAMFLETLGAAELRAGDAAAAMAALERSRARQKECTVWTLLHLAIARAAVGDGLAARQIVADLVAASEPMEKAWRDRLVWRVLQPEAEQAAAAAPEPRLVENSIGMKLVPIRAGRFTMGAGDTDQQAASDERPAHDVSITLPFFIGQTEVTNAQWRQVMGAIPSKWKDDERPVETVSWDDAVAFCEKLSALPEEQQAGRVYRLPTEAEWEYACRAGTATRFSFGNDEEQSGAYGWFGGNSDSTTHPVGAKRPNPWGLYDVHGNVFEWCSDWYDEGYFKSSPAADPKGPNAGSFRVIRGGSWRYSPVSCRSAYRSFVTPSNRNYGIGFRVVLSVE